MLTAHAAAVIAERQIRPEWIARALETPDAIARDRFDSRLRHALARIPEHDDRMLRVVYDPSVVPRRVVTAFFDRSHRRRG